MGRILGALLVVALLGSTFAAVAMADEAAASDGMREMIREEIKAYHKDQSKDFRVYWKNGLNMKSGDGNFKLKIGGRIMADFWFFDDYDENLETAVDGEWHSGFEFRRARLYMSGTIYKYVIFKAQYDFAGGDGETDFKDVYIGLEGQDCLGCMWPRITVGHFKEYFSLEEMTSSKYITFLERALPVSTFAPVRNSGVGLFRNFYGDRATIGAGVFGNSDNTDADHLWEDGYNITGRITFLPWAPCDCESRFLHLGVSASWKNDVGELRYRTRPETHIGPRIVDTGTFAADSAILLGGEIAFGYDRWHFQAEYITSIVDSDVADDPTYYGYYAEASYMLLGGTRPYRRDYGVMGRVKPCTNLWAKDCCGFGGLELAARYSYVDLDDGLFEGGKAANITAGVNWYLNPNTAVKLNYTYVDAENAHGEGAVGDGNLSIFGTRFQVDF